MNTNTFSNQPLYYHLSFVVIYNSKLPFIVEFACLYNRPPFCLKKHCSLYTNAPCL